MANTNSIKLQNKNGKILASSLDVAEKFGKNHKDVLESIRNLVAENSAAKFFYLSTYENRGKEYPMYLMDRDGFSLLAMGFTGKKAIEWKIKYIEAFNKMEEKLKETDRLSEEDRLKLQLFSKDPGEVAYAHNRLLEMATAPLIEENNLKQDVINGLTDDIPIYEKADIINRICKKVCSGYANRYKELYKCFKENYHIDLQARCENYNAKQEKRKDYLTVIRYAEKFGYIEDLFSCCVKLYEGDVDKVIEEMRNAQEGID